VITPIEITLLTRSDCALCDHAKDVLGRVAADYPLRIAQVDLNTEQGRHLAKSTWVVLAPGVLIDGKPFSHGRLSERKLRRTLNKRRFPAPDTT